MKKHRDYEELGDIELPAELDLIVSTKIEQAERELEEARVNFRWGVDQVNLVKQVALQMGIPYQTYIKQVLYRQVISDLENISQKDKTPNFPEQHASFNKNLLLLAESAKQFAQSIIQALAAKPKEQNKSVNSRLVYTYFTTKAYHALNGVSLLASSGFTEQSLVLAQGIIELGINTAYISKSPIERSKLFVEYNNFIANRWFYKFRCDNLDWINSLSTERKEQLETVQQSCDELKTQYPIPDLWSGKSLEEMAGEVGAKWYYDFVHSFISEIAHSAVTQAHDYITLTGTFELQGTLRPIDKYYKLALLVAVSNILLIMSHVDEHFNLRKEKEIRSLLGDLNNIVNGVEHGHQEATQILDVLQVKEVGISTMPNITTANSVLVQLFPPKYRIAA